MLYSWSISAYRKLRLFCNDVSIILCRPDFEILLRSQLIFQPWYFCLGRLVQRLSFVYIVIPYRWQKAMIYFWNWKVVFVPGAGQAREHVCTCINWDLSGEVPSATRRGMQPYCVKCLLCVSYVERVSEWVSELVSEWMSKWMK